jgi:hypothetical protein
MTNIHTHTDLHLQKENTEKGLAFRDKVNVRYHDKEGQTVQYEGK